MAPLIIVVVVGAIFLFAMSAGASTPSQSKIQQFAEAIAYAEGYWNRERVVNTNSRPARNNNPGDIEGTGDSGNEGVYAKFSTIAKGWARLNSQVAYDLSGQSPIYQAPGNAPFSEFTISDYAYNYTATAVDSWSENVASWLGVTRDTKIVDWLNS